MKFPELVIELALRLLLSESYLGEFRIIVPSIFPWPAGLARDTVVKYLDLRESNGHDFAVWSLLDNFKKLQIHRTESEVPIDEAILRPLYLETLKIFQAENLAMALLSDPGDSERLISEYQKETRSTVEKFKVTEAVDAYFIEHAKRIAENKTCIEIAGFQRLSKMIGGFNPGRIIMLLAETGFGKTNLGISLSLAASKKLSTLYFNMEMGIHDFTERIVVAVSELDYVTLNRGQYSQSDIRGKVAQKKLYMTNGRDLSIQEIKSAIRSQVALTGLEFVVVDYDQKLVLEMNPGIPEWKALQNAVIALESIAKELNLSIMILAQQNSEGGISGSRRSTFSASTVLKFFMHEDTPIIQAVKNRFGKRDAAVKVEYKPEIASIREIDTYFIQQPEKKKFI